MQTCFWLVLEITTDCEIDIAADCEIDIAAETLNWNRAGACKFLQYFVKQYF